MSKDKRKKSNEIAENYYDVSDYNSKNKTDKGLAITHEQVSDDYTEGTIDGKIDAINSKDEVTSHDGEDIPRQGYNE